MQALQKLPTLFVEETSGDSNQLARVGTINGISPYGVTLHYSYDLGIPPIPNTILKKIAAELNIDPWEFQRTHWAVKDVDLFRCLMKTLLIPRQHPRVFNISGIEQIQSHQIAVMMPFGREFDEVYSRIQETSTSMQLTCKRADDIFRNPQIMQDVVTLIDTSRVVIADCTGKNPNVYYEIGIAHTLGRDVIMITQSESDVTFDLQHLRYIKYHNNEQGHQELGNKLREQLHPL